MSNTSVFLLDQKGLYAIMNPYTISLTQQHVKDLLNPTLGATVVHIPEMTPRRLDSLRKEVRRLKDFRQASARVGTVEQNFFKCTDFDETSIWQHIARECARGINTSLDYPGTPLTLNEFSLHQYPETPPDKSYAIGPHRDHKEFENLVLVLLIQGPSNFYITQNRQCDEVVDIQACPGDLIVMRGHDFAGLGLPRPMHFVKSVGSLGRISFGMRQMIDDVVAEKRIQALLG